MKPSNGAAEEGLRFAVLWLKLAVEVAGAAMIGMGVVAACSAWIVASRSRRGDACSDQRLQLARLLAFAPELQLGADMFSTAVAPTREPIGKLASIGVNRTAFLHFLQLEMR